MIWICPSLPAENNRRSIVTHVGAYMQCGWPFVNCSLSEVRCSSTRASRRSMRDTHTSSRHHCDRLLPPHVEHRYSPVATNINHYQQQHQ